jgi:hypothetical protein
LQGFISDIKWEGP